MIDGCPECVLNTEPPRSSTLLDGAVRCAYLCSDCGHAWTTDWAAGSVDEVRDFRLTTWENKASPNGALTPPGSDRQSFSRNERG